jgi:hypothetical protein
MTPEIASTSTDELPIPKLCREMLIAIEGLNNWDSHEGDEHLDFFGYLLEDLNTTSDSRRGSFPLIEQLNVDNHDDIIESLEELNEFAEELKEVDPEERQAQYTDAEVQERVEKAEEIYDHLARLEESYTLLQ